MKRERYFLLLTVLTLIIFAVLALVYRDVVRQSIVIPIYYLLWIIFQAFLGIPQTGCLAIFALMGLGVAIMGVRSIREPRPAKREPIIPITSQSRYRFWLKRCQQLDRSMFFLDDTASELRRFLLNVLAYQEHRDTLEMESLIAEGTFDVPPAVRDLVAERLLGHSPERNTRSTFFSRFWERLFSRRKPSTGGEVNRQLEQIISYLEERLEVHCDQDNR
ncbi:MAG: hypothetical protein JXB07_16190 [Anaerolineae bacterium]|nr:hypothetical protein [Anaerolineae bacterium]